MGLKYLLAFLCPAILFAQQSTFQHSVGISFLPSKILRHSESLMELPSNRAQSTFLDLAIQTDTAMEWAGAHAYPKVGVSIIYNHYQPASIHKSYALVPFIEQSKTILNGPLSFTYHLGWGLGYATKIYDSVTNPENNAVSTHLNVVFDFRFGLKLNLNDRLDIFAQGGLLHYSNAAQKFPNYGINLAMVGAGLHYNFGKPVYISSRLKQKQEKELLILLNYGRRKLSTNTDFSVGSLLVEYNFFNGLSHKLGVGVALMNDGIREEYYQWANFWGDGQHRQYSLIETLNLGPYLNYEIVFSNFSLFIQGGAYILYPYREFEVTANYGEGEYHHFTNLNRSYIFNKVGFRYRFENMLLLHLGMKTHLFQAQYVELGVGVTF